MCLFITQKISSVLICISLLKNERFSVSSELEPKFVSSGSNEPKAFGSSSEPISGDKFNHFDELLRGFVVLIYGRGCVLRYFLILYSSNIVYLPLS